MMYRLQIAYFGKEEEPLNIVLNKDEVAPFFDKATQENPYLNEETNTGVWVNLMRVKYIVITPDTHGPKIEKVEKEPPQEKHTPDEPKEKQD